jgi:hypothetical protein
MSVLRELTDQAPTGGYHDLYKAVLDGRLRTQRRGREYDVARSDLPAAAAIVGIILTDTVAA